MPADRTRRTRATSAKAFCVNKNCENYKVEVEVSHGDLKCEKCGSTMQPVKGGGNAGPNKGLIAGIAAGVILIGGGAWYALSGDSEPVTPPAPPVPITLTLSETNVTDTAGVILPLSATIEPRDSAKTIVWETTNPEVATYLEQSSGVKFVGEGIADITVTVNDTLKAVCKVHVIGRDEEPPAKPVEIKTEAQTSAKTATSNTAKDSSASSSKTAFGGAASMVKYGNTYTLTFKKSYRLDLHNGDVLQISAGDRIDGAIIRNGRLTQGTYTSKSGDSRFLQGLNNPI